MMAVGMPPVQAVHQVGVSRPLPTAKRGKWLLTSRQIAPRMYLTRSTKATDRSQFSPRTASPAGALGVIFYPASKKAPTPHHTTPQHDQAVDLAWREEKWKFASQQITSARDIKKNEMTTMDMDVPEENLRYANVLFLASRNVELPLSAD